MIFIGIVETQDNTGMVATWYNYPTPWVMAPPVIEKKKEKKKE